MFHLTIKQLPLPILYVLNVNDPKLLTFIEEVKGPYDAEKQIVVIKNFHYID